MKVMKIIILHHLVEKSKNVSKVMKRADKLKINDVFTKSELDRRTCNTNGDFDPVPYFYNIDYAYNSCQGASCNISSRKNEEISNGNDDVGYPTVDKFKCCMKQATCQNSKYEDGRQINDSEGVCNTEDDDTTTSNC